MSRIEKKMKTFDSFWESITNLTLTVNNTLSLFNFITFKSLKRNNQSFKFILEKWKIKFLCSSFKFLTELKTFSIYLDQSSIEILLWNKVLEIPQLMLLPPFKLGAHCTHYNKSKNGSAGSWKYTSIKAFEQTNFISIKCKAQCLPLPLRHLV